MNIMFAARRAHLLGLVLYTTQRPNGQFYAALRWPDADELTPELGWGEGPKLADVLDEAFESFDTDTFAAELGVEEATRRWNLG